MGGRGSSSSGGGGIIGTIGGGSSSLLGNATNPPLPNSQNIANQPPNQNNTPIQPNALSTLSQMNDDQLAALVNQSKNVQMPNHLSDRVDATQKFVYAAGLNEKPTVLDDAAFNKYLSDNNIPKSQIMSRSAGSIDYTVNGTHLQLTGAQTMDTLRYSSLTYIGGKHGGQAYGAGAYFDMDGGTSGTGYGFGRKGVVTAHAVLSKNANVIKESQLRQKSAQFAKNNPKFASAVGSYNHSNMSIYALAQGYNVIAGEGGRSNYRNVIDRSALVMSSKNY